MFSSETENLDTFILQIIKANIPFCTASGLWPVVHFWSIGVEEQFYLFWPWLAKYSKRRLLQIAIIICCFWLVCKYGSLLIGGKCLVYLNYIPAPFRIQYMAVLSLVVIMSQLKEEPFVVNLETPFFDFIGKISYGIYVIHPILIFLFSRWYCMLDICLSELAQRILI